MAYPEALPRLTSVAPLPGRFDPLPDGKDLPVGTRARGFDQVNAFRDRSDAAYNAMARDPSSTVGSLPKYRKQWAAEEAAYNSPDAQRMRMLDRESEELGVARFVTGYNQAQDQYAGQGAFLHQTNLLNEGQRNYNAALGTANLAERVARARAISPGAIRSPYQGAVDRLPMPTPGQDSIRGRWVVPGNYVTSKAAPISPPVEAPQQTVPLAKSKGLSSPALYPPEAGADVLRKEAGLPAGGKPLSAEAQESASWGQGHVSPGKTLMARFMAMWDDSDSSSKSPTVGPVLSRAPGKKAKRQSILEYAEDTFPALKVYRQAMDFWSGLWGPSFKSEHDILEGKK